MKKVTASVTYKTARHATPMARSIQVMKVFKANSCRRMCAPLREEGMPNGSAHGGDDLLHVRADGGGEPFLGHLLGGLRKRRLVHRRHLNALGFQFCQELGIGLRGKPALQC